MVQQDKWESRLSADLSKAKQSVVVSCPKIKIGRHSQIADRLADLMANGMMIIPTMKEDSVNVEKDVFSTTNITNLIDVLRVDKAESPQLAWLSDGIDWLGYATTESIYSNEDKEMKNPIGKQIRFAGVFPAEDPKYTICVVADKQSLDIEPAVFQDVVYPLSQWLLKKK